MRKQRAHRFHKRAGDVQRGAAPGFPNAGREVGIQHDRVAAGERHAVTGVEIGLDRQAVGQQHIVVVQLDVPIGHSIGDRL